MNFEGGLLGLGAAAAWGTADMGATVASRRVGSIRTTAFVVPVSAAILVSLFVLSGASLPPDPSILLGSVVVGAFGSALYFIGYAAFRAGPISIVSPIFSGAGGLTVILAIVVLGERPSPLNLVAAAVATIGVILAAVVRSDGGSRLSLAGPGVRYALVVLVIGGILPIITTVVVRQAGWLPALTTARIANTAIVALALFTLGRLRRRRRDRAASEALVRAALPPTAVPVAVQAGLRPAAVPAASPAASLPGVQAALAPAAVPAGVRATSAAGAQAALPAAVPAAMVEHDSSEIVEPGLAAIAIEPGLAVRRPDEATVPVRELGRSTIALLFAVGAIEAVALTCFYAGLAIGPTWLVGLTSSLGPLIVVSGGVLVFGERPRRAQWAGVAMILASVIVLAVR